VSPDRLRPVAFYVHHHGSGHANRTRLLCEQWPNAAPLHVFTSAPERFAGWEGATVHTLPYDYDCTRDPAQDILREHILHYAPVDLPSLQQRMAIIANWIAEHHPSLFVVDLSVEVALFVRLCGVRVALMRLHGRRDDPAHLAAFQLADRLIAPFPAALEDAHTPDWVREKTVYLGAFSRYDDRKETKEQCRRQLGLGIQQKVVTIINGAGGGAQVQSRWEAAAQSSPEWTFLLVGEVDSANGQAENLWVVGRVADTYPYLKAADVVIGSGGTNTMMEVGAARVPYLSMPEPRPFDEQHCKMGGLAGLGLTRMLPERVEDWPSLLTAAEQIDVSGWDRLKAAGQLEAALTQLSKLS
jgi:hypothetical protein